MYILSIDIGTSSVKAGIISHTGELVDWGREGLGLGPPEAPGENLSDQWLSAIRRIIPRLSRRGAVDLVVVSGNGPTLVPIGHDGHPCGPVLLWLDTREERIEGSPSFFLPKIAWLRRQEPAVFEQSRMFISCPEFVSYVFTGTAVTVTPNDEFTKFIWTDESVTAYGIDPTTLPPYVSPGEPVGGVTAAASDYYGIPVGTPVCAGGPDFLMCLLGTAAVRPGRTCDRAGTSEGINHCAATEVSSDRLRTLPHIVPGCYNVAGILSSTGRIFEWFRRISGQQEISYEKMLSGICRVPHDSRKPVFLPSIHRGATWEFSGAVFAELDPDHGVPEMGRAVVESIGFSVRDLVETLEANSCPVDELRVSGGQARNSLWNQMKADITGKPISVSKVIDSELLGDAIAGLVGIGEYSSLVEGAEDLYRVEKRFEPEQNERREFNDSYARFCEARERMIRDPISH